MAAEDEERMILKRDQERRNNLKSWTGEFKEIEYETEDDFKFMNKNMPDDIDHQGWWARLSYYRWIINFWVIGIPWTIFTTLCTGWNIFFNIDFNHWWAEGNVYLIATTIFMLLQNFNSFWLALEIPAYLRHFKVARLTSLMMAVGFNSVWLFFLAKWFDIMYIMDPEYEGSFDSVQIFEILFVGYNIVMNFGVFIVNLGIISKELSMEFFQLLNKNAGSRNDDVSLGITAFYQFWFDLMNPLTWL